MNCSSPGDMRSIGGSGKSADDASLNGGKGGGVGGFVSLNDGTPY